MIAKTYYSEPTLSECVWNIKLCTIIWLFNLLYSSLFSNFVVVVAAVTCVIFAALEADVFVALSSFSSSSAPNVLFDVVAVMVVVFSSSPPRRPH